MRVFLGIRKDKNYENDKSMSRHYYGSRKGHSRWSALLEKILTLDLSKIEGDIFACTMHDLEAFCDRH